MVSRRAFLKKGLMVVPATLILSQYSFAQQKKKKGADAAGDGWAVPGKGVAASIKYVENKSAVVKSDQVTKSGVPFEKQTCENCMLYKNGICVVITDKNSKVKKEGWCPTWTLNPAVKT